MAPAITTDKLPSLDLLGRDLLAVTSAQKTWSILRPLLCVAAYFTFASHGWWIPAVFAVAGLMFITYVSTSHDLLHRTLGFPRWLNEGLLIIVEMLALRSGHAFRISHLCHHRHFPDDEDIEGRVASMSLWRALLEGMGQQTRLFIWAWPRARRDEKLWMAIEGSWAVTYAGYSVVFLAETPVFFVYMMLIVTSSWLYPVATVWIPHRATAKETLFQTHAVRGRIVPELFLQHTYHLEHHLYPSVPSFNWQKLAKRLDPYLRSRGVEPIRVP
jgi:beta-carotene hydroxylase